MMDWVERIQAVIRDTAPGRTGIDVVLPQVAAAMTEIAQAREPHERAIRDLNAQAIQLAELGLAFADVAHLAGADGAEVDVAVAMLHKASPGISVARSQDLRTRALAIAEETPAAQVTAGYVVERLEKEFGKLPWKLPRSVVSTYLFRSPGWDKKPGSRGVYVRVGNGR